jgi:hypothetical protein
LDIYWTTTSNSILPEALPTLPFALPTADPASSMGLETADTESKSTARGGGSDTGPKRPTTTDADPKAPKSFMNGEGALEISKPFGGWYDPDRIFDLPAFLGLGVEAVLQAPQIKAPNRLTILVSTILTPIIGESSLLVPNPVDSSEADLGLLIPNMHPGKFKHQPIDIDPRIAAIIPFSNTRATFIQVAPGTYLIDGTTLSVGGMAVSINSRLVSALQSGVALDAFTQVSPGTFLIDGTTLSVGGPIVSVNGVRLSALSSGVVVVTTEKTDSLEATHTRPSRELGDTSWKESESTRTNHQKTATSTKKNTALMLLPISAGILNLFPVIVLWISGYLR